MKEQIRIHKGYKLYLTPEDQFTTDPDVWSWTGRVFDNMNDCIYSHYFTIDDVLWGGYTVDYMFQRMIFDLDRLRWRMYDKHNKRMDTNHYTWLATLH